MRRKRTSKSSWGPAPTPPIKRLGFAALLAALPALAGAAPAAPQSSWLLGLQQTFHDVSQHVRKATVKVSQGKGPGHGTGFLIDPAGWIVSNYHVAPKRGVYNVELADGRVLKAKRIGYIRYYDMSLLRMDLKSAEEETLPFLELADSDAVKPGALCIACGNPFEYSGTLTWGTITAVGRVFNEGIWKGQGLKQMLPVLVTDCPINPGNSGGPMVDLYGRVLGINSAIVPQQVPGYGRINVGVGFVIPANIIRQYLDDLKRGREFDAEKPWVGVSVKPVSEELAAKLSIPCGLLVKEIDPRGPASDTDLAEFDVITHVNGVPAADPSDLETVVSVTRPGRAVKCALLRRAGDGPAKALTLDINVAPYGSR